MEASNIKRSLDVFRDGRLVGRYDLLDDGSELFSYDADYLQSADAAPISHSLPLRIKACNSSTSLFKTISSFLFSSYLLS